MTLDKYFEGKDDSRQLCEALHSVIKIIGKAEIRVTKSQVVFRRRKAFAWVWMPGKYLRVGKRSPILHRDDSLITWSYIPPAILMTKSTIGRGKHGETLLDLPLTSNLIPPSP